MRVRIVSDQLHVFVAEVEQTLDRRIQLQRGQGARFAAELKPYLIHVVRVDVGVAQGVYKVAHFETEVLGHHVNEQGVRGDVERNSQKDVRRALVQLARQLAVDHVKLKKGVAGGEGHLVNVPRVPGRNDVAAPVGVAANAFEYVAELVHWAVRAGPKAPLVAVHWAQIAPLGGKISVRSDARGELLHVDSVVVSRLRIGGKRPIIPNSDSVLAEVANVGVARNEPNQLVQNALEVQLFSRHHREALGQIKAHLVAKHTAGSGACAVGFVDALAEHAVH